MARGLLITFEGGEGAGKSTQLAKLADRLEGAGREVIRTREPGGSPGAETIRRLLVRGATGRWSPTTETLLMYAARRDHIERLIAPGLERGAVILCDRFADSTRAYQGAAGGASPRLIGALEREVLAGIRPDLTLIFDLPAAIGLERAGRRGDGDNRFEAKGAAFHERLRAAFLAIAENEPARCVVIGADPSADVVAKAVWAAVSGRLTSA